MNKATERYERQKLTARRRFQQEGLQCLQEVTSDSKSALQGMEYFYDRYRELLEESGISNDQQVVASMCMHVPAELIYALGARPVRICAGVHVTDTIGAEHLPAKACPLVKSTLGAIHMDMLPVSSEPIMTVNPTTCDQKRKLGEVTAGLGKELYTLELPPTKDSEEAREYWLRSVKKFILALEKATGQRLTRGKLKSAIGLVAEAQSEYRRFHKLRQQGTVINGNDALLVTNAHFFDDIEAWTLALKKLNGELEQALVDDKWVVPKHTPRVLITGSPSIFPNLKLPLLIEQSGAVIVEDEFCSGSRMLHDTVAVDEWFLYDMIPAVADRYLKPSTCPNFTPNTDRDRKLLTAIKDFNVDGVIYQSFAGCQLYEIESLRIGKMLEQEGVPMLYVETDYNPDDGGQLSTRVEAFIDSLNGHKQH